MKYKRIILDYFWITISSILTALAVNMIFKSTGLAPGGITGLSIIFSTITNIPISYMTLAISVPLLIMATVLLGKSFGIKTLYITIATPICMSLIPSINITEGLAHIPLLQLSISAIVGGLLVGSAIGIALNHDCATGGTDVIALLIQYFFKKLKLSNILLFLDGFVVIASGVITKNILISAFSFFALLVIIQTI
ncbi:YitT family protein, partial [Breznakia sp. OttesenSCG-928-G09]|nr:YitT family protein [Breznakia sp. OttesenSCG-928-G09]